MIKKNEKIVHFLFLIIFIIGLFLRIQGAGTGVYYWDGARYLNEARWFMGDRTDSYYEMHYQPNVFGEKAGYAPISMKTGFVFFLSLVSIFFGVAELSGILVNILFFALTFLIVIHFVGEKISHEAAIISGAALALSPTHIFFSHTNLTEVTFAFFFLISIFFFLKAGSLKHVLIAGILSGFAFQIKEFGFLLIPLFFLCNWKKFSSLEKIWENKKLALIFLGGFFSVFILFILIYWAHGLNYFEIFLGRMRTWGIGQKIIESSFLKDIPYLKIYPGLSRGSFNLLGVAQAFAFFFMNSMGSAIILILGLIGIFWHIKKKKFALVLVYLTVLIFLSQLSHVELRHVVLLIPLTAIFAGASLEFFKEKLKKINKIHLSILFAGLIFIFFIPQITSFSTYTNHTYREIGLFLTNENTTGTISVQPPIDSYYTKKRSVLLSSLDSSSSLFNCFDFNCLNSLSPEKYSHIVVYTRGAKDPLIEEIIKRCKPIKEFESDWDREKIKVFNTADCLSSSFQ